jgi:RNA polymerase sigma factor (sigma-70 family)
MLPQPQAAGPTTAAGRSAPDEPLLIAAVARGDLRAFESLYRLYHPRLTRFVERMTRRPTIVDEVLNDTLLVVWNRAASYNGKSLVSTWIFAIAYRKALKALKRFDEPAEDHAADERVEPGAGPEQHVGRDQLRLALLRALEHLTPEHRAVVDLTYFHDLGYREIAQIVDCPVDTVKTRMFYARRRLKALLPGTRDDWL